MLAEAAVRRHVARLNERRGMRRFPLGGLDLILWLCGARRQGWLSRNVILSETRDPVFKA
jgi:hypothetical protein